MALIILMFLMFLIALMIAMVCKGGALPITQSDYTIDPHQFNDVRFASEGLEPALQPWS